MVKLGKVSYLYDARTRDGKPVMSIICDRHAYRRKDGSVFIVIDGARHNLTEHTDGSLSLTTYGGVMPGCG